MKCPVCGSTKLRKPTQESEDMRCDRCGYTHKEKVMGKVLISKTGCMDENWWMR